MNLCYMDYIVYIVGYHILYLFIANGRLIHSFKPLIKLKLSLPKNGARYTHGYKT